MKTTLSTLFDRLRIFWNRFEASRWWRATGIVLILASLGLMGRALYGSFSQFRSYQVNVKAIPILIGLLFAWIALWMGTFAWGEIVRALHPELPRRAAINYHLVSIATKYLPGLGWQQVSKVYQLYKGGIPAAQTWQSVLLELVLMAMVGLAIAAQLLFSTHASIFELSIPSGQILAIAILLWACCAVFPVIIYLLAKSIRSEQPDLGRFLLHLWLAELLDLIGWLALGLSFWFTIQGIASVSFDSLPYFTITLVISLLTGLVIVFVPNGLGVREAVMFTMLQRVVSVPVSIIAALSFRIVSVLAELLGVLPVLVNYFRKQRTKK